MGTTNTKEIIDKEINEQINTQKEAVLQIYHYKSLCQTPLKDGPEIVDYANFDSRPVQEINFAKETTLKNATLDKDRRKRVNETREWPHSVHGVLSMKFEDRIYTGTATMIGPNIAITTAHNLYNIETKKEVKVSDVHFYPAANGQLLPFGSVKVLAFYYPEEYKTDGKENYALLILEYDIGDQTGYFGLHAIDRKDVESKKINITGYPADKVIEKPKHHEMWEMEGSICQIDDDLISYEIDTDPGQSGSGIWYEDWGNFYIIGDHVGTSNTYSQGTFLSQKRAERIKEWVSSFYLRPENAQLQLRFLCLGVKFGDKASEYISKGNFPRLRQIHLKANQISDKGVKHLSKANFPRLESLFLSWNKIGDKGVEYLSKASLPQLQRLDLEYNLIGEKGIGYLSKASFPQLQTLFLNSNNIGDKGVEYLNKANFPQLERLYLVHNQIGAKGAEYLSKANFPKLQILEINDNHIGDKGAEYLSKADFPQLKKLQVMANQITEKGAEYISKAIFPELELLSLGENQIGDKGVEFITKANFPQLNDLVLCNNQIGDKGAEYLSIANFPQLKYLYIPSNNIGDIGVEFLSKAHFLPHLELLTLTENKFGEQGEKYLQQMEARHSNGLSVKSILRNS